MRVAPTSVQSGVKQYRVGRNKKIWGEGGFTTAVSWISQEIKTMERSRTLGALALTAAAAAMTGLGVQGFSLPGVQMTTYTKGERLPLFVNSLTSSETLLPLDYYKLPFCQVWCLLDPTL